MYFEFKDPSSCYTLTRDEYKKSVAMRFLEFLLGALGMIIGSFAIEICAFHIGGSKCPGTGNIIGYAVGLTIGPIVGFLLGMFFKWCGNRLGLRCGYHSCFDKTCCLEDGHDDETNSNAQELPSQSKEQNKRLVSQNVNPRNMS